MKKGRFSEEQNIAILREQDVGVSAADVLSSARGVSGDLLQVEGHVQVSWPWRRRRARTSHRHPHRAL